jgi:hypothetical protein
MGDLAKNSYFYFSERLEWLQLADLLSLLLNSKVEYDVTLYSVIGDLFGQIGNNLLKDLNYTHHD